jgi:hypothetical protein
MDFDNYAIYLDDKIMDEYESYIDECNDDQDPISYEDFKKIMLDSLIQKISQRHQPFGNTQTQPLPPF